MRKIKEVLRLKWDKGLSNRKVATACGIGRPTVTEYVRRAGEAGLTWPLPAGLDEAELERRLFPPAPALPAEVRGIPDWSVTHR
jgi:DNA-binding transcriptional regulator LsrR (DeoR family)